MCRWSAGANLSAGRRRYRSEERFLGFHVAAQGRISDGWVRQHRRCFGRRKQLAQNRQWLDVAVQARLHGFAWFLADQETGLESSPNSVHDAGDALVVRMHGEGKRVLLANIINVSASATFRAPRVTLRLARPGRFGDEIAFSPKRGFSFNPLAKCAMSEDLIVRVDLERATRQRGCRRTGNGRRWARPAPRSSAAVDGQRRPLIRIHVRRRPRRIRSQQGMNGLEVRSSIG